MSHSPCAAPSMNKSHIPSLPKNNAYIVGGAHADGAEISLKGLDRWSICHLRRIFRGEGQIEKRPCDSSSLSIDL